MGLARKDFWWRKRCIALRILTVLNLISTRILKMVAFALKPNLAGGKGSFSLKQTGE